MRVIFVILLAFSFVKLGLCSTLDMAFSLSIKSKRASYYTIFSSKSLANISFDEKIARLDANTLRKLMYTNTRLSFINTLLSKLSQQKNYKDKKIHILALKKLRCEEISSHFKKDKANWVLKDDATSLLLQNILNINRYFNSCYIFIKEIKASKVLKKSYQLLNHKIKKARQDLLDFIKKEYSKKQIIQII